ncbi:hypothetical protein ACTXJF_05220 [Psychrobacter alimentarius]|uniref:hypothetical protein n=1 Tax=Psychrobacter alimentarius TaxID=261164 RepID=UPI003FD473C6
MKNNKNKCWAAYFGNCEGEITAEHLVSKSLFPDGIVFVEGFDWCKNIKKVGINSLTRKILCKKHNNEFSILDSEAKYAINCFAKGKTERPIDGLLFERWLLKTAINLSIDSDFHIGIGFTDSIKGYPSPYAVALALGEQPFAYKMGMYFLENKESFFNNPTEQLMMPMTMNNEIGLFLFGLRGANILLSLTPNDHEVPKLSNIGLYKSLPVDVKDNKPVYRPHSFTNMNIETGFVNSVEFSYT